MCADKNGGAFVSAYCHLCQRIDATLPPAIKKRRYTAAGTHAAADPARFPWKHFDNPSLALIAYRLLIDHDIPAKDKLQFFY